MSDKLCDSWLDHAGGRSCGLPEGHAGLHTDGTYDWEIGSYGRTVKLTWRSDPEMRERVLGILGAIHLALREQPASQSEVVRLTLQYAKGVVPSLSSSEVELVMETPIGEMSVLWGGEEHRHDEGPVKAPPLATPIEAVEHRVLRLERIIYNVLHLEILPNSGLWDEDVERIALEMAGREVDPEAEGNEPCSTE